MAETSTTTVTLRIPSAFNEWLDAYRHLVYPERIGKQQLMVEGLSMAFMRRGWPGQPTPDFDAVAGHALLGGCRSAAATSAVMVPALGPSDQSRKQRAGR